MPSGSSQTARPTGVTAAVGGDANMSLSPTRRFVIKLHRPGARAARRITSLYGTANDLTKPHSEFRYIGGLLQ